jgi:aspartyl-tRNA synthetase
MLKTHNCGELRLEHVGQTITLAGWVNRRRDMGGVIFIDLRDRSGKVQVVANAEQSADILAIAEQIRPEYVLQISGTVRQRMAGQENPNMPTGAVELIAEAIVILNASRVPPIQIDRDGHEDESVRLKYRYLDLRRERLQRNLQVRHRAVKFIRDFLDQHGFLEIETPILFKSTPEGARDYLVPSRVHPGKFYALPQSPQQLKQLLMVAGYERYFQIARCFRDEDQRKDRQPEFTQLDLEMSFVERDDILNLIETLMVGMVKTTSPTPLAWESFPRLTYREAIDRYGSDRPDIRFGMELADVSDIAAGSTLSLFADNVAAGKVVRAICVPGCGDYSRKQLGELEAVARSAGARGLPWLALSADSGELRGSVAKHFTPDQAAALIGRLNAAPGDLILFASDKRYEASIILGTLRDELGERLGLRVNNALAFCWVIDFPLFEEGLEEGVCAPAHHMFTAPKREHIPLLDTNPHAVLSEQYDLVCNGYEVAGGSIRIHERALQNKIMQMVGFSLEEAREQFGHMLEAFEYGAPPHGGIAPGIDRLVALMCGEPNIREVMAFPKNQSAMDLMADAPSHVIQRQLNELHIALAGKALPSA